MRETCGNDSALPLDSLMMVRWNLKKRKAIYEDGVRIETFASNPQAGTAIAYRKGPIFSKLA